jgi:asparaginyl-tRNA synthetase
MSSSSVNPKKEKTIKILKIRAKLLEAARSWFKQNNYTEVQGPIIIPTVGDWTGSFEIKYFNKKAYLAQGLQPYAAAFVTGLEKIYTIAPTFRAEKQSNQRHLTEYWRIEVAQQCTLNKILHFEEKLVAYICQTLSKEPSETFECFNRSTKDLVNVKTPFPEITYDKAINKLQGEGFNIVWGQKITQQLEKHISQQFKSPFFITKFPLSLETYFTKSDPQKTELTLSADLIAPEGYMEIGSTAQRITNKKVLFKRMTEENTGQPEIKWYLSFMQKATPHSGFAIGLERLIQWICKLEDIKEATAFPRTHDELYP